MGRAYRIAGLSAVAAALALPAWVAFGGPIPRETSAEAPPGIIAQETGEEEAPQEPAARPPDSPESAEGAPYEEMTAQEAIRAHEEAGRGPRQPIPFSHRFHVSQLQIDCMYCHLGTEVSVTGVVPSLEVCMGCHRVAGSGLEPVEELRGYWERGEQVPWEWVYKLPEFVQFTHRPHLRNQIPCETCHGQVAEMDRVYQATPLTMGWCLDCHRAPPQETDVATDHLLVADASLPDAPRERQPESLYPTTIDVGYGEYRGPDDCFVCHY